MMDGKGMSEAEKVLGMKPGKPEHRGAKFLKMAHEAMQAGEYEKAHGHMQEAMKDEPMMGEEQTAPME